MMTWKTLVPAVALALAVSTGVASADPTLQALISSRAAAMATSGAGGVNAFYAPDVNNPSAPVATGWHFYHCGQNGWFFNGNQWYYVFTQEDGVLWFEINNLNAGLGFLTACHNGNWQAVFVTDTSGAFNETANWWYK